MKDRVQSGHNQRLELLRTCDLLSRGPAQLLKSEDLSATQYNVLRILRGAERATLRRDRQPYDYARSRYHPAARPSGQAWLDLALAGMKGPANGDAADYSIGFKLLARLDDLIEEIHRKQLGHLGGARLRALAETAGCRPCKSKLIF